MKSFIDKLLFGCALLAMVTACSDVEETKSGADQAEIAVSAGITTRAVDSQWGKDDAIGITMLGMADGKVIDPFTNYCYKTDGANDFKAAPDDKRIYFPNDGSEVTFKSYYPYQDGLANINAVPVEVSEQVDLPAIDFMTAEHVSGNSKKDTRVQFHFYHRLSKLIFHIKLEGDEASAPSPEGKLMINGMRTKATYDLMGETLSVNDGSVSGIDVPFSGGIREAIVLPRNAGEGITFTFTKADGRVYIARMDRELLLKSGYKYTFNIVLKETPIEVSATIEDWIEAPKVEEKAIAIGVELGENENVKDGEVMHVYYGDDSQRQALTDFTYDKGSDKWIPTETKHWEDLPDETTFYADIAREHNGKGLVKDYYTAKKVVTASGAVNLTFQHVAAQLIVVLNSKTFTKEELEKAKIILPDYSVYDNTKSKITNGVFEGVTKKENFFLKDVNEVVNSALIPEQSIEAGTTIAEIMIGNRTYPVTATNQVDYLTGKSTQLNINIEKTAVLVSAKVREWVTVTIELAGTPIVITGTSDGNDTFITGDEISFFILDTEFLGVFKYDGSKWSGTPQLYWDDLIGKTEIKVASVFPKQTVSNNTFNWDVLATGQTGKDLLMTNKTVPFANYVNLKFEHVLSKASVKFSDHCTGFALEELQSATMKLTGMNHKGVADITTSVVAVDNATKANIPLSKVSVADKAPTFNAFVMPQTITNQELVVTITQNGVTKEYTKVIPKKNAAGQDLSFNAGEITEITVTLTKTGIEMLAKVEPWKDGPTGDIEIK